VFAKRRLVRLAKYVGDWGAGGISDSEELVEKPDGQRCRWGALRTTLRILRTLRTRWQRWRQHERTVLALICMRNPA